MTYNDRKVQEAVANHTPKKEIKVYVISGLNTFAEVYTDFEKAIAKYKELVNFTNEEHCRYLNQAAPFFSFTETKKDGLRSFFVSFEATTLK